MSRTLGANRQLRITVAIPVGPEAHHKQWLDECLESVARQTRLPDEVLLIDDMAGLDANLFHSDAYPIRVWQSPWRLGVAHAFNFGVALAEHELVLMLGADDRLEPACVESCLAQYEASERQDAYYHLPFVYATRGVEGEEDSDKTSTSITNMAMVTKGLWRKTGGFPIVAALGPCDYIMGPVMDKSGLPYIFVKPLQGKTLYWFRCHMLNEFRVRMRDYPGWPHETVRILLAASWKTPEWGRYE